MLAMMRTSRATRATRQLALIVGGAAMAMLVSVGVEHVSLSV